MTRADVQAELTGMAFGKTYVVEVGYDRNNVIHRAVAFGQGRPWATFFAPGYEDPAERGAQDVAYLRVIAPVPAMDEPCAFFTPTVPRATQET